MRLLQILLVVLLMGPAGLFAQRSGARAGGAGGRSAPSRPSSGTGSGSAIVSGAPRGARPVTGLAVPYPYAIYPGYFGGFVGGYTNPIGPVYTPAAGTYDSIFGVYGPDPSQGPIAVVNPSYQQDSVRPQVTDYSNTLLPPPGPAYYPQPLYPQQQPQAPAEVAVGSTINGETPLILIAMKDHTINPALAYWIQGDTINYVVPGGAVNHASLSQVDRDLSLKLNADRRPDFKLP